MNKNFSYDKWLRPVGAFLLVTLGLVCLLLSFFMREGSNGQDNFIHRLLFSAAKVENWFYDSRTTRFYQHPQKSPHLVIAEINDESLNKIGRWPWSRKTIAKIINNLNDYGAKTIMFDVIFPEPESEEADSALADSIKKFNTSGERKSVILGYGITDDANQSVKIPDELQLSQISGHTGTSPMAGPNFVDKFNFVTPKLVLFEANYGFISAEADMDGVFRHYKTVIEQEGTFFPSLAVAGFNQFYSDGKSNKLSLDPLLGSPDYELGISSNAGKTALKLNQKGEVKIRFFGGVESFEKVSIDKIALDDAAIANSDLKNVFSNKAVLIGSSAFAAHDLRNTPVDPQSPGMIMHANFFHALDEHLFFRDERDSLLASLLLYFLGIGIVLFLSKYKEPLYESVGILSVVGGTFGIDYFYLAPQGYFIRLFSVLSGSFIVYGWFLVLNVFKEAQEKKKIKDTFQRYVAPEIVKEMLAHPDKLKVGGEKKEITMIFSDVRDFTTISERLTPMDLATLLNIYMGKMTDILFETQGTLDKYIGDALVGFWGAPLDVPDHAYHAVRGASQMLEALPGINKEFAQRKYPQISVGIGLNTGEVSVGNMGSDKIFQYTALGDNMNLASRLESLTKYYGVGLMISEFTLKRLGEKRSEFRVRPLDSVQVKGKTEPVKIFEVIVSWNHWWNEPELLAKFTDAYENLYLKRKFSEAMAVFEEVLSILPNDKATQMLKENTAAFLQNPPPEAWNGVKIFNVK